MDLNKLFRAKSMAVVGASEKSGFGGDTCRNILEYRKDLSRVYFVHPVRETVLGVKCYHSLSEIDDEIELAIICTAKQTVNGLLREAKAKGCGGAVIFASGYSETGTEEGRAAEEELRALAQELDIAILGPNCGGFHNYVDDVVAFAFPVENRDRRGSIGFLSQSGQFCINLMDCSQMHFSYAVSIGNGKIVTLEDYMDFLIEDEQTKVVAVYMEGVQDAEKFAACLKKAALRRKPVVIQKGGRSELGQKVAASHTGALAGSDRAYDAVFDKFGVIRAEDMQELMSTALLLATLNRLPARPLFASMNISGGETAICADMGSAYGIEYPEFQERTVKRLEELLPSFCTPRNPLDMTAALCYDGDLYAEGLKTVMEDPNVEMVLIGLTIQLVVSDPTIHNIYYGVKKVLEQGYDKPVAILPFIEGTRNQEIAEKFRAIGVPILPSPKYAFCALRHLTRYLSYDPGERELALAVPTRKKDGKRIAYSERKSKEMLRDGGIPVKLGVIAADREEARRAADETGYPAVMKIESDDILHKSDVGGVVLNIQGPEEALAAWDRIMENVTENAPDARINGILVQPMMEKGLEMILGVKADAQFGLMLLVGLGGVFVEVFQDSALYPVPVNRSEARRMLESLVSYRLLGGYRGKESCDVEAVLDRMTALSNFAAAHKEELRELDINPLFVYKEGKGVEIADALVVLEKQRGE
ncbi:MAG: acetate--CoA ligase family protein [Eubacteriales bacterium]|nr:acetate--CoA ligase family protein [Eubacteriales bacterium]